MNNDIDGLPPVALQGRVPVKVIGKVPKGERLTTSDVRCCMGCSRRRSSTYKQL